MRKITWVMLLTVMSGSVMAHQWVHRATHRDKAGHYTISYADPITAPAADNRERMRDLLDYTVTHEINGKSYMSIAGETEYDCKKIQVRTLHATFHSGNMGKGKVTLTDSMPGEWLPVVPSSIGEVLWKTACGGRHY